MFIFLNNQYSSLVMECCINCMCLLFPSVQILEVLLVCHKFLYMSHRVGFKTCKFLSLNSLIDFFNFYMSFVFLLAGDSINLPFFITTKFDSSTIKSGLQCSCTSSGHMFYSSFLSHVL